MKVGLVLEGGGGRGAYALGVWKALTKLGLAEHIEVFSGTSIGAINAALFAQGDMKKSNGMWKEVTIEQLIPLNKYTLIAKGLKLKIGEKVIQLNPKYIGQRLEEGAVSKEGAREILNKYLELHKIKANNKICYVTCTQIPDLEPRYFRITDYDDEIAQEMIIASASLPVIYDCAEILDEKYVDGGIVDNVPILPVYEEGCDIIIVIRLKKGEGVDKSLYPETTIIEIMPTSLREGMMKGVLNLDMASKAIRVREGYKDTMDMLEDIMELASVKYI